MLKQGRAYIKGYRLALVIIQLFMTMCWLVPITVEMVLRRYLPVTEQVQGALLLGSFLLNRMLLAPANIGYYACCRRLATIAGIDKATSEIEDLREAMLAPTLLSCFFLDYRHPMKALKWQLRYDALRFVVFAVLLFPALLFVAIGAKEESPLLQAVCCGGGILCGFVGVFCYQLLLLRLRPMLYRRPQYGPFWTQIRKAWQMSCGCTTKLLLIRVKYFPFTALFLLPGTFFCVQMLVHEAVLFSKPEKKVQRKNRRVFHTRVLRDA